MRERELDKPRAFPCAVCRREIYGAHYRVYQREVRSTLVAGHGCDLLCMECSLRRNPAAWERWYAAPFVRGAHPDSEVTAGRNGRTQPRDNLSRKEHE